MIGQTLEFFIVGCNCNGTVNYQCGLFVEGAKGLARRVGMAEVVIGLTIVSIGTSLPEILLQQQRLRPLKVIQRSWI